MKIKKNINFRMNDFISELEKVKLQLDKQQLEDK